MNKIFQLTLKSALKDMYLFFWSLFVPIAATIGLGHFIDIENYEDSILTGMTAVSVLFYAFMTTAFAILSQRRRGVYNLLHITPMPLWKYIISISSTWTIISAISSVFVLIVGTFTFKVNVGIVEILLCLPVIILSALSYIFLSFVVSRFCKNEANANMLCNFVTLPFILCSSAFYSLEKAPQVVKFLNTINPFEYFVDSLRIAMNLKIQDYILNIVILFSFLVFTLFLATKTFRYNDIS